jgi:hypothetical protein
VEATEEIFVGTSPHVVKTGLTVCGWRTLVEDPRLGTFAIAHGTLKNLVLAPTVELGDLKGHEVDLGAYWAEHEYSSDEGEASILPSNGSRLRLGTLA